MNIPIFPLSIYLLPGGVTRLRIFEQRYLSMIKNANETHGFVISHYQKESPNHISEWGSWVDIINFELGDDNVLIIDVKCKGLVNIKQSESSYNQLLWGEVEYMPHWAEDTPELIDNDLSVALKDVFDSNPDLAEVYQGEFNDDLAWVCARWMELLPLAFKSKDAFAQEYNLKQVVEFLTSILKENAVGNYCSEQS